VKKNVVEHAEPVAVLANEHDISKGIDRRLVWIMAVACAFSVANLYYVQPLLSDMSKGFGVSAAQIGLVATIGQVGYACGLLLIVPLGDKYNQRTIIVSTLAIVTVSLVIMAVAPTFFLLVIASFLVGLTTVVPQLIIPYAANLASDGERGRVVGTVMSGLLIGILLARTVSGYIGAVFGWRQAYWMAAILMILLAVVLRFALPNDTARKKGMSYPSLMKSLWDLIRREPVLRETSLFGALTFGTFSAFWVTLSFLLATPPYHFGSEVAGLFGLVGVAGALAASFVGKFADRSDARYANGAMMLVTLVSFVLMWLAGQWLIGLIIGVILLDLGAQGNQVANQTRVYSLNGEARNRLNTVYMFLYFVGGSLGSLLGTYGWSLGHWNGVGVVGCGLMIVALGAYVLGSVKRRQRNAAV
jgi:predicted MFS family arabinose efflux permease